MYKFLIATSETIIGKSIKESAVCAGYDVTEVKDGTEVIQICEEVDFDIIVMDTALPKIDGFSACKEIRKFKKTPIILISSSGNEHDKILGFEMGSDDYMVKPLSIKVLMAKVNAIINRQTGKRVIV